MLRLFCEQSDVHWAQFSAIGAVENVEIGYYDLPIESMFGAKKRVRLRLPVWMEMSPNLTKPHSFTLTAYFLVVTKLWPALVATSGKLSLRLRSTLLVGGNTASLAGVRR